MSMSRRVASRAPATSTETGWSSRKSTRPLRSCRVAETLPVPNADRRLEFLFEIASDISHESVQRRDRLIEDAEGRTQGQRPGYREALPGILAATASRSLLCLLLVVSLTEMGILA